MKLESILSHNAAQDDESIRNVLQGSHIAVCCNIEESKQEPEERK